MHDFDDRCKTGLPCSLRHAFGVVWNLRSTHVPAIAQHRTGIATICQRFHVSRLEVFGSAARADDFDPATSDVDFLIKFADGATPGLQDFFGAKTALEQLLGRAVDLVEPGAVRNPCVLASINRNREAMYAA